MQRRVFQAHRGNVTPVTREIDIPGTGTGAHQVARGDILMPTVAEANVNVAHLDRAVEHADALLAKALGPADPNRVIVAALDGGEADRLAIAGAPALSVAG